jgi:hypothetical protein
MSTKERDASAALKSPEIRRTVAAREKLFSAVEALDTLPTSLIEVLAAEITDVQRPAGAACRFRRGVSAIRKNTAGGIEGARSKVALWRAGGKSRRLHAASEEGGVGPRAARLWRYAPVEPTTRVRLLWIEAGAPLALGIGPAERARINPITRRYSLYGAAPRGELNAERSAGATSYAPVAQRQSN